MHLVKYARGLSGEWVPLDYPSRRIGSFPADASQLQTPAVEHGCVAAPVLQPHRTVRRGCVEVGPVGVSPLDQPQVVVPPTPHPALSGQRCGPSPDSGLQLNDGGDSVWSAVQVLQPPRQSGQMAVGVVNPGQQREAPAVNYLRTLGCHASNIGVAANRRDASTGNGHCLGAALRRVHGQHVGIDQGQGDAVCGHVTMMNPCPRQGTGIIGRLERGYGTNAASCCSSAWYELRTSGPEATCLKPISRPAIRNCSNSCGV